MKIKKYLVLLLAVVMLMSSASCSDKGETDKGEADKAKDGKAEITIDVIEYERYLVKAIDEFNKTHETVKIKHNLVSNDTAMVNNKEYRDKYMSKLITGDGPDIIRIEPWLISAVNKVASSGILYDLNNLIKNDDTFKLSDYNQKAMESGIIKGKRYFVPVNYNFSAFAAKAEDLKKSGIIPGGSQWTLQYLAEKAWAFREANKADNKYLIVSKNVLFSDIVKNSGLDFINYEKKKASLNSREFIDLLNIYKKLYPAVVNDDQISYKISSSTQGSEVISAEENTVSPKFENSSGIILDSKVSPWWFEDIWNKKMNMYLYPQYTSKRSILIEPQSCLAINSKSKYKKEAFDFLKLLISDEYQSKNVVGPFYIPVNNNAYLERVNYYIANLGDSVSTQTGTDEYDKEKRKQQVKAQLAEIESISRCDKVDSQIYDIMDNEVKPFIEGRKTAEQTADIIQDKVMLFLNE